MSTTPVSVRTAKYHVLPDHNYLQCDIDVVLLFATDGVATDLTVLGINGDQNQNGVNVTEGGRGEAKTICPKRRLALYCLLHRMTTWTALSPILSIKPVSSRAPGRSRLLPRTCDHVVIVIVIVIVFFGHHQHQQRKTKSPELEFPPAVAVQEGCAARCDSPDINDINIVLKLIVKMLRKLM